MKLKLSLSLFVFIILGGLLSQSSFADSNNFPTTNMSVIGRTITIHSWDQGDGAFVPINGNDYAIHLICLDSNDYLGGATVGFGGNGGVPNVTMSPAGGGFTATINPYYYNGADTSDPNLINDCVVRVQNMTTSTNYYSADRWDFGSGGYGSIVVSPTPTPPAPSSAYGLDASSSAAVTSATSSIPGTAATFVISGFLSALPYILLVVGLFTAYKIVSHFIHVHGEDDGGLTVYTGKEKSDSEWLDSAGGIDQHISDSGGESFYDSMSKENERITKEQG